MEGWQICGWSFTPGLVPQHGTRPVDAGSSLGSDSPNDCQRQIIEKRRLKMRQRLAWLNKRSIFVQALSVCLIATAVLCVFKFRAHATPPSGLSFTPIVRATLPEFSVKRKIKARDWEMEMEAE